MTENSVVRARIDEATKTEAAAVLASLGLSLSDAFRLRLQHPQGKPDRHTQPGRLACLSRRLR